MNIIVIILSTGNSFACAKELQKTHLSCRIMRYERWLKNHPDQDFKGYLSGLDSQFENLIACEITEQEAKSFFQGYTYTIRKTRVT